MSSVLYPRAVLRQRLIPRGRFLYTLTSKLFAKFFAIFFVLGELLRNVGVGRIGAVVLSVIGVDHSAFLTHAFGEIRPARGALGAALKVIVAEFAATRLVEATLLLLAGVATRGS